MTACWAAQFIWGTAGWSQTQIRKYRPRSSCRTPRKSPGNSPAGAFSSRQSSVPQKSSNWRLDLLWLPLTVQRPRSRRSRPPTACLRLEFPARRLPLPQRRLPAQQPRRAPPRGSAASAGAASSAAASAAGAASGGASSTAAASGSAGAASVAASAGASAVSMTPPRQPPRLSPRVRLPPKQLRLEPRQ